MGEGWQAVKETVGVAVVQYRRVLVANALPSILTVSYVSEPQRPSLRCVECFVPDGKLGSPRPVLHLRKLRSCGHQGQFVSAFSCASVPYPACVLHGQWTQNGGVAFDSCEMAMQMMGCLFDGRDSSADSAFQARLLISSRLARIQRSNLHALLSIPTVRSLTP